MRKYKSWPIFIFISRKKKWVGVIFHNCSEKLSILTTPTKVPIKKMCIAVELRDIVQKKAHKICFQNLKKSGGWGSEQCLISLWSFDIWNFGFFYDFLGFRAQNFIFLQAWTAKWLNLYLQEPIYHKTRKITTKFYDNSWKMSKISKSPILNFQSAIAPTMVIFLIYKYDIRNSEVKDYLFWNFEEILTI